MGTLTEFFNSDDLELPGSWDTYPGSFEQFIKGIFAKYLTELTAITPVDYISNRVLSESATAKCLCVEIEKCLAEFLLGHPPKAYNVLAQVLQNIMPCFKALNTLDDISNVLSHFYRIRSDGRSKLSKGDIFHVPFELRHTVATYRYSIPGLPCLYFGGSVYVCWEECGQPVFDSIHVARFQPAPRSQVQLLDFGWRPAQMAALIDSGRYNKQLSLHRIYPISSWLMHSAGLYWQHVPFEFAIGPHISNLNTLCRSFCFNGLRTKPKLMAFAILVRKLHNILMIPNQLPTSHSPCERQGQLDFVVI